MVNCCQFEKADGPVLPLSAALAAQLSETCRGCRVYGVLNQLMTTGMWSFPQNASVGFLRCGVINLVHLGFSYSTSFENG